MKKSRSRLIPFLLAAMMFAGNLSGKEVDRWDKQTPFRDQHDRGTCVTHASIAAIEAAYVRQMGFNRLTFDLSEQYLHHVQKTTWWDRTFPKNYENQSCYWFGGSPKDIVAVLENYRIPEERFCPFENDDEMQGLITRLKLPVNPGNPDGSLRWTQINTFSQEDLDTFEYHPEHVDVRAYKNARFGAKKVVYLPQAEVQDTDNLEDLIDQGNEVVITMEDTIAPGGVEQRLGIWGEDHAILLVGYDDERKIFYFKVPPQIPGRKSVDGVGS